MIFIKTDHLLQIIIIIKPEQLLQIIIIKPDHLLQIIIIKPEQLLQMIIIKPEQLLQIYIIKPEQLLQIIKIIIIKPEQLLLAPSSSPWPQWLIPKIIFSSGNLFSFFKIAEKNPDIFQIRPHRRRRGPQICRYLNHTFTEYHDDDGDDKGTTKKYFFV